MTQRYFYDGRDAGFHVLGTKPTQSQWQVQREDGLWVTSVWDKPWGDPQLEPGYVVTNLRKKVMDHWHVGMDVAVVNIERCDDLQGPKSNEPNPYLFKVVAIVPRWDKEGYWNAILLQTATLVRKQ